MVGAAAHAGSDVSPPTRLNLPLVARRPAGRDFTRLILDAPSEWLSLPGQFVNILCESDPRAATASEGRPLDDGDAADWPQATGIELSRRWPVVRRPLSISRVRVAEGSGRGEAVLAKSVGEGSKRRRIRLELLVRTVGTGTRFLASRPVGTALDVVGPLGNHFTPPADDRTCILVGGGCGVAPLFGLADYLHALGKPVICVVGANTAAGLPLEFREPPEPTGERIAAATCVADFAGPGIRVILTTDDGSAGFRGTATEALDQYFRGDGAGSAVALYGCGPEPMLRALARLAGERRLDCQVSTEGFMGCGIGVCLSCARKRRDAASEKGWTLKLTCRDGPVVDATEIVWE